MDRVKKVLDGIVERFKSGDIPEAVAFSCFPVFDVGVLSPAELCKDRPKLGIQPVAISGFQYHPQFVL